MEFTDSENGICFKFIPKIVTSFDQISKQKLILKNDVFEKYEADTNIKGELLVCKNTNKLKKHSKVVIRETYDEYLQFIQNRDFEKDRWIYNIIDGLDEQDKILYKDIECVIVPTYTWDGNNIQKLHILCLHTNKTKRCLRDLTAYDIPWLIYIQKKTISVIKTNYGLNEEKIKAFIHYEPSTYHLHIHFVNVEYVECASSVEYSHDLNSVIFNLSLDSDYYKKIVLNKRI